MTFGPVEQAAVDAAVQAAVAAVRRMVPELVNAQVMAVDPVNRIAKVFPDVPGAQEHDAYVALPYTLRRGDRVKLVYTAPTGCSVIGRLGGDSTPWLEFGEGGAPFLNGWGHRPDAGEVGENKHGRARYRLLSGRVELGGWLQKLSGSANNAAQLRSDCYPPNIITRVVSNGLGEPTTIQISPGSASVPGAILSLLADTHLCLDGVTFSVLPNTAADPL